MRLHAQLAAASAAVALLFSQPVLAEGDGAKGLFLDQLDKPDQRLNTGIEYWIDLIRNGEITQVNNKTVFYGGDRIQFHVKPNVDGFAYIFLKNGSRGEKAMLFPDPSHPRENKVMRGKDYALPEYAQIEFDRNPGTEHVTIVVARTPVDAEAYLKLHDHDHTVLALADGARKDLVPRKVVLEYSHSDSNSNKDNSSKSHQSKAHESKSQISKSHEVKSRESKSFDANSGSPQDTDQASDKKPVTTVVLSDPSGILAVDIPLKHR